MRIFETGFDAGTTQYGIFGTGVEGDCRSAHGHGFSTFRKGCCIHERAPVVSESIVAVISPSLEEDPAAQGELYKAVVGGRTGAGAVGTEKNLLGEAGGALYKRDRISSVPERSCGSGGCA